MASPAFVIDAAFVEGSQRCDANLAFKLPDALEEYVASGSDVAPVESGESRLRHFSCYGLSSSKKFCNANRPQKCRDVPNCTIVRRVTYRGRFVNMICQRVTKVIGTGSRCGLLQMTKSIEHLGLSRTSFEKTIETVRVGKGLASLVFDEAHRSQPGQEQRRKPT
jgi:hypothetical protein